MERETDEQRELIDRAVLLVISHEAELRRLRSGGGVLVHHTSPENAKNILIKPELWLRNARLMPDDPTEILLGRDCVNRFLVDRSIEFSDTLNAISPHLWEEVRDCWNAENDPQIDQTYIASFTSAATGDFAGNERHWESYGCVAFHFDPSFLKDEPWKLGVYAVKVTYRKNSIENGLLDLLTTLNRNRELLAEVPHHILVSLVRHRLFFVSVGSKSENFEWEKEWRLVHSPCLFGSAEVAREIVGKGEGAQPIYPLPLRNTPDENSPLLDLSNLIRNIVIHADGPKLDQDTRYALRSQLLNHGVTDATTRVVFSQDQ